MPFPFAVCPPVCLGQVSLARRLLSPGSLPLASSTAQSTISSIINILPRWWVENWHSNLFIWLLLYLVGVLLKQECKNTDLTTILWSIISQISEIRKRRHREDKWLAQDHTAGKERHQGLIPGRLQSPCAIATALYCLSKCMSMICTYADLETAKENGVGVTGEDVNQG